MSEKLYSIRMRASRQGDHISGAERIVHQSEVSSVTAELIDRAMKHELGRPDSISVNSDEVDTSRLVRLPALRVRESSFKSVRAASEYAVKTLERAGVSGPAAWAGMDAVIRKAPGVRGAMLMDAATGALLGNKGIRARMVDCDRNYLEEFEDIVRYNDITTLHFREALVLATKVSETPGLIAELCISDDPSYVTGYVASARTGYQRITPVKTDGDSAGGRVWFVDSKGLDLDGLIEYVRNVPVLVTGPFRYDK